MSGTNSGGGAPSDGFIQKILSMFAGSGNAEAEKKRLLKKLGKDISHSRFRFLKPKGSEALPALGRFFYEIYKVVAPAQVLLANSASSGALKSFVIDTYLSKEQRAIAERLTDSYINEQAAAIPIKQLQDAIKQDMIGFFAAFDAEKTNQIDALHNTLLSFINFINFDFFFLLKKFDSNIQERVFAHAPKFDSISGAYLSEDLCDFLEVFLALNMDADWKRLFGALKEYRNIDVIQVDQWIKLVPAMKDVRSSGIIELLAKYLKADPDLMIAPRITGERIVEPFIDKLKNQTELLVQKIVQERRNSKIEELAKQIFGTTAVVRLKNYTERANAVYSRKMLGGFVHTEALNYLKAYLIDYFKKDIRELVDILIIKGEWSTNILSQQLSDGYHALLDVSEALIKFDESLGEDGDMAPRLRNALNKSDRDKDQIKYVRQLLKDVNDKAFALINKAAINMIAIGRHMKSLIDDYAKPHHELLLNWKDVENASEEPIKDVLTKNYKRIYYMVQLLQYFTKTSP